MVRRLPLPMRTQGTCPSLVSCHKRRGEMPRAFAASRGRKAKGEETLVGIIFHRSNGSLATKCGSHNRWRSVRYRVAEQLVRRGGMPGKCRVCRKKKILQVFGI